MNAVRLVLRLRPGGLLHMGPPCSSFVFMNSNKCKRKASNNYKGDEEYGPVIVGNLIASITALLLLLAHQREVEPCVENPPHSTIWRFPPVQEVLQALHMSQIALRPYMR